MGCSIRRTLFISVLRSPWKLSFFNLMFFGGVLFLHLKVKFFYWAATIHPDGPNWLSFFITLHSPKDALSLVNRGE